MSPYKLIKDINCFLNFIESEVSIDNLDKEFGDGAIYACQQILKIIMEKPGD